MNGIAKVPHDIQFHANVYKNRYSSLLSRLCLPAPSSSLHLPCASLSASISYHKAKAKAGEGTQGKQGSKVSECIHLQQTAVVASTAEMERGSAGTLVATQCSTLLPAHLALNHTSPACCIRRPFYCPIICHIHLHE